MSQNNYSDRCDVYITVFSLNIFRLLFGRLSCGKQHSVYVSRDQVYFKVMLEIKSIYIQIVFNPFNKRR